MYRYASILPWLGRNGSLQGKWKIPTISLPGANSTKISDKDLNIVRFFSRFLGFSEFFQDFFQGFSKIFGILFLRFLRFFSYFKNLLENVTKIFFQLLSPHIADYKWKIYIYKIQIKLWELSQKFLWKFVPQPMIYFPSKVYGMWTLKRRIFESLLKRFDFIYSHLQLYWSTSYVSHPDKKNR